MRWLSVKGLTSGRMKLLTVWLLKPLGWEMPSAYWAGSQRAKGVLEAPSRGFFLKSQFGNGGLRNLAEGEHIPPAVSCGLACGPTHYAAFHKHKSSGVQVWRVGQLSRLMTDD